MTERKNARSAVAAAEQAGVGICYDILSSHLQSTTPPFVRQVSCRSNNDERQIRKRIANR